jgi:hypothetical protein
MMKETKVYSDCYQTTIQVFHRTKSFSKPLRPTLGRRIEEAILDCLVHLRRASVVKSQTTRLQHLQSADESLDEFRTLIQLSSELRELNLAGFSELSKLSKEIGRELGGWIRHESKRDAV